MPNVIEAILIAVGLIEQEHTQDDFALCGD